MKRFYFQLIFTLTFLFSFNGFTQNCDPPTITCPSDIVLSNDPGECGAIVNYDVLATSNCSQTSASEDFEGPTFPGLSAVNGASQPTILPDPTPGATNGTNVLSIISNSAGLPWQQAELELQSGFELDLTGTDKRVSIDWYSIPEFSAFIRVDNLISGTGNVAAATAEVAHPGGGWQTLVFDLSTQAQPSQTGPVPPNGIYRDIYFFNHWDIASGDFFNPFTGTTTYVDNITEGVASGSPQSLIFSEDFIQGQLSPHCSTWQSFRASLLDNLPYTKVTIKGSNDPIGVSVTDPAKVLQLANGLRTGAPVSLTDDGHNWQIGGCGNGIEIIVDNPPCACGGINAYALRPCIGVNANWGGVGTGTCNNASQTLTIEFEVADDSGSGDLTIVSNPPSGSIFPIGTTTVTSTATDASGNASTCSFDVTVVSDEAPITCPENITQNNDPGLCGAQLTIDAPDTNDNCTVVSITNDFNGTSDASGFYPVGTTPVTWTVTYDGSGTPTPPDVAVLSASSDPPWEADVLTQLTNSGAFNSVTGIDVAVTTPTLADLQQYDAVLVWNDDPFANEVAFGNVLADYVDAGGGVVVGMFTQWTSDYDFVGNFANGYLPLNSGALGSTTTGPHTMNIIDGTHPIMQGVTSFNGGARSFRGTNLSLQPGATLLANWSTNDPLIAYKEPTNGKTVSLNFFPPSSIARQDFWNINTDGTLIMANALVWASSNGNGSGGTTATCSFDVTVTDTEAPTIDCTIAGPQNSLTNESFENNNGHDSQGAANWTQFGPVFMQDQNVIGTAQNGDFFVKMFGGNSGLFQDLPVNAGDEITGTVFMQNASFDAIGPVGGGQIKLEWQGTGGVVASDVFTNANPQNLWTEVAVSAIAPAGATGVRFVIICNQPSGGAVMFDNASLINNSQPGGGLAGDVTVSNDPGACGAQLTLATPATADNCEVVSITNDYTGTANASGFYPVGTTTVTWTVTDSEGLTSSCSVDITVEDTEAPMLDCAQGLSGDNVLNNPSFEDAAGNNTPYNSASWTPSGVQAFALDIAPVQDGNFYVKLYSQDTNLSQVHPVSAGDIVDASIYLKSANFDPFLPGCQARIRLVYSTGDVVESAPIIGGSIPVNVWTQISVSDVAPAGATSVRYVAAMGCSGAGAAMFDNASMTITTNPGLAGNVIVDNDLGQCGAQLNIAVPDHGDNCPDATLTNDFNGTGDASGFYPIGTTTVTWTITDAQNLSTSCSIDVIVNDTEVPTIACPGAITQDTDPNTCGAVVTYSVISADNCPNQSITQTNGLASGSEFPVGTTTNTFVVTDASGNMATCSFDVIIEDKEAPSIICAGDITQDTDPSICGAVVSYSVTSADNCPNESITQTTGLASGSEFPVGTTTNTFVVTDASGNTSTCSFDVIVEDNENPTIACPGDITQDTDPSICGAVVTFNVTSDDNCPNQSITQTTGLASGSEFPVGTTTNTFVVTDASGNTSTCSFDVIVEDKEAPTIACPGDITQDTDPNICGAVVTFNVTSDDNCPNEAIAQTTGLSSGSEFPVGTTTNTFVVTDASGNTATCSFDVIVEDKEAPTIACPGDITQETDPNICGAVVTFNVTSDDNCPNQSITQTAGLASGSEFPVGTTTNTFVVTDASGNTATCSFDVIIEDKEAPTIACAGDITQDTDPNICGAVVSYSVTSADNCPNQAIAQTTGLASGSEFPVGTTTNTFVVTDASGNTATCSFTVTVTDNEDPVAICPADITVSNDPGDCSAVVNFNTSFTDNCTGGSVVASPASGSTFDVGSTLVTVTATDAAGNTNTCTFNVTVIDDEAPIVDCFNLTVTLDDDGNGGIDETAFIAANGSTDNCEIASISLSETAFNCDDIGGDLDELIISEYVDGTGNNDWIEIYNGTGNTIVLGDVVNGGLVSYYSINIYTDGSTTPTTIGLLGSIGDRQVYKISHTDAPNISGNPTNNFGSPLMVFDGNDAIALSNNGVAVDVIGEIGVNPGSGWTSTSNATNATTLVRSETVQQGNVSSFVANFETEWTAFTQNDVSNLGGHTIEISDNANNVILTVTDIHGNVATCEGSVTVVDATLPEALCQNVVVQLDANGNGSTTAQAVDNGSNDACGIASLALSQTQFTCANIGPNPVTLTVTDSNGNESTCTATVTVLDEVGPAVVCNPITVQLDSFGNYALTDYTGQGTSDVDVIGAGSTDACGIATMTVSPNSFTCADVNSPVTVTLTVTDINNNVSTCQTTVTVEDNVDPEALCQPVTVQLDANGEASIEVTDIDNGSNDACGIASRTLDITEFSCTDVGAPVTVVLTVTDNNGNTSTCESLVTVLGDIPTVSINAPEELPEFCQGAVLVLTTTATDAASYLWSPGGETTESIEVGPQGGTFTVTVTSATNCSVSDTFTVAAFDESTLLSAYTILAEEEVFLHGSNLVQSGGIGATDANGLIKLHQATNVIEFGRAANIVLNQGSTIVTPIYQPAEIPFPDFVFNDQSNNASPDVTINTNQSTILNGSVYGTITVRQGATVTFSQSDIYIDELRTFDGAAIEFSGCANVFINTKFMLAQNGTINANGNNVVMYVNEDVQIEKGSYVRARIHSNGNELLAKGPNGNANNSGDLTQMIGLFIAKKVHGNKNVVWNADDLCAPCPISPTNAPIIGNVNDFGVDAFDVLTWPNPSDTEFNVQLKTLDLYSESYIEVFDISNKLVFTGTFKPQEVYAFGKQLEGGVYIVKVQQGQNSKTIRVVKY